jgi:formate hydrogenlyase subunit 3/multisubunit Na+/H+ antiporter MnhD subunit
MTLFCIALALLGAGSLFSLLLGKGPVGSRLPAFWLCGASLLGLVASVSALLSGGEQTLSLAWSLPFGRFSLRMDALSAFFLIPTFLLAAVCAVYGQAAFTRHEGKRPLNAHWFFFHVMVLALALVLTAADGFLFLLSWEAMSLSPFFLISFYAERDQARSAAWIYLVASHLGGFFLIALIMLLSKAAGGDFSFQAFEALRFGGGQGALLFGLALIGFGVKAGIAPLHVWLPEAYPAAPSHVSAFMSGVLSKAGVYGLFRLGLLVAPSGVEVGLLLLGLGLASGVYGVLLALAQNDLKRMLSFSSVENSSVILAGLGLGLFASNAGLPGMAVLGYAGALLQCLNLGLAKGLLFLVVGAATRATGASMINRLGGLQQRMPLMGACFGLGAAAIIALPPLNCFAGEFLLYLSLVVGHPQPDLVMDVAAPLTIFGLAAIGGLALLSFAKAYGLAFLGAPRSEAVLAGRDPGRFESGTLVFLAALCALCGVASPLLFKVVLPVASRLVGGAPDTLHLAAKAQDLLWGVAWTGVSALLVIAILTFVRKALLHGRNPGAGITWDCGYVKPSASMQYSGGSFAQPMTWLLGPALRGQEKIEAPGGYFPSKASVETTFPDWIEDSAFRPAFEAVTWVCNQLKCLQHGRINLYILYILIALMAALFWAMY